MKVYNIFFLSLSISLVHYITPVGGHSTKIECESQRPFTTWLSSSLLGTSRTTFRSSTQKICSLLLTLFEIYLRKFAHHRRLLGLTWWKRWTFVDDVKRNFVCNCSLILDSLHSFFGPFPSLSVVCVPVSELLQKKGRVQTQKKSKDLTSEEIFFLVSTGNERESSTNFNLFPPCPAPPILITLNVRVFWFFFF